MSKLLTLTSALALGLAIADPSIAQGRGNGHGGDHAQRGDDHGRGRGGDAHRGRGDDDRGRGRAEHRGRGHDRELVRARFQEDDRGRGRGDDDRGRGRDRDDDRREARGRGSDDGMLGRAIRDAERSQDRQRQIVREVRESERRAERDLRREVERLRDRRDDRPIVIIRDRDRGLIDGCPPGLAWRNNGCLPPGQARRAARDWDDDWRRYDRVWNWDRDDRYTYRYDDGYVYRLSNQGSLLGYLPVLGGALGLGNVWPQQYAYEPAPRYYTEYYRMRDPYDYRYADGVIYGVDPQTQAIRQVVALVTGQPFTVGQQMPAGYDVYNVPYAYRSQYRDTPDSWYRYNDGYVYQVDPTTQLVQAVIQLLT